MFNLSKTLVCILSLVSLSSSYALNTKVSPLKPAEETVVLKDSQTVLAKKTSTDKVNLNHASAEQISKSFKGIGPKRSKAIVAYRESHGVFNNIKELSLVKGISKRFVEKNEERLQLTFIL